MTNILLVEDEPLIAEEICQTLRPAGYKVIDGFNGAAPDEGVFASGVMELIDRSAISMVLMDINLAGKYDGVELGRRIREKNNIPVIFITGYSDAATLRRAVTISPSGYLVKPITGTQLLAQIQLTLQQARTGFKGQGQAESQSGLWHLTLEGNRTEASFNWLAPFGYDTEQVGGFEAFWRILHDADVAPLATFIRSCRSTDHIGNQLEFRILDAGKKERWILMKILRIETVNGSIHITALNFDITDQKQREMLLQYRATHDGLTDLYNRAHFMAELQRHAEVQKKPASYGVLFADLDKFKPVNDEYGHATGDRLLIEVAQRFKRAVKKKDIVARFGGDEFVFLIREIKDQEDLLKISRRILGSLADPIRIDDKSIQIGCSIGGATNIPYDKNPSLVLHDADVALYETKKNPQERFRMFEENAKSKVYARLMTAESLRNAVKQEQFTPYFRPIMALSDKPRIAGLKIEMNWNHPFHGSIPYASYQEAAEESGLIIPVTLRILEKALDSVRGSSPAQEHMLALAHLNRRLMLLRDWSSIIRMLSEQYTEAGVSLIFEVDESSFSRPTNLGALRNLQAAGVRFSLNVRHPPRPFQAIAAMPFDYVSLAAGDSDDLKQTRDFCTVMLEAGKTLFAYDLRPGTREDLRLLCRYYIPRRTFPLLATKQKTSQRAADNT